MATTKISELNPLLSSDIAGNDVLPIVDTDGNETKKASITALQIPLVSTGIGNCVEAVQTNSTCTQIVFGGKNNCIDASGSATTNTNPVGTAPPVINTCSGYNFIGVGHSNKITGSFSSYDNLYANASNTILGGTCNKIAQIGTLSDYKLYYYMLIAGGNIIGGGASNRIETLSGNYTPGGNIIGGGLENQIYLTGSASGKYLQQNIIGGGYQNCIIGDGQSVQFNTISGGYCHVIETTGGTQSSLYNIIAGGGFNNKISAGAGSSGILAGQFNQICGGQSSVILGGDCHMVSHSIWSSIASGCENLIYGGSYNGIISGRKNCIIRTNPEDSVGYNVIGGGCRNKIQNSQCSMIAAGYQNLISGSGCFVGNDQNFIGGGCNNKIFSIKSSILGGENNTILGTHNRSFIIGQGITSRRADALHVNNLLLETGSIPTSDPGVPGMLYIAGGALKVSGCL